jgi:hypothetical protein
MQRGSTSANCRLKKKAYNSVRREKEVLYNILMEFGVPISLVKKNL